MKINTLSFVLFILLLCVVAYAAYLRTELYSVQNMLVQGNDTTSHECNDLLEDELSPEEIAALQKDISTHNMFSEDLAFMMLSRSDDAELQDLYQVLVGGSAGIQEREVILSDIVFAISAKHAHLQQDVYKKLSLTQKQLIYTFYNPAPVLMDNVLESEYDTYFAPFMKEVAGYEYETFPFDENEEVSEISTETDFLDL